MARAAAVFALVVGCGPPSSTTPDANVGLQYSLAINSINGYPGGAPSRGASAPQVFIDGVATRYLTVDYSSYADGVAATHHVELRSNNLVVAELVTDSRGIQACSSGFNNEPLARYSEDYCELESGELRYAGDSGTPSGPLFGGCNGDSFCSPRCAPAFGPDNCGPGLHCSSLVASTQPLFTRLACVPNGTKQVGEACTLIPDPAGAYDDCSDNSLCVAGTCQAMCLADAPGACASCTYVDGEPPELRLCSSCSSRVHELVCRRRAASGRADPACEIASIVLAAGKSAAVWRGAVATPRSYHRPPDNA